MTTYDIITELCKQKGMAITALEKELGFGRGYIGKFRTRGLIPTAKKLQKIADYFGVTTDYLLTGKEEHATELQKTTSLSDREELDIIADR